MDEELILEAAKRGYESYCKYFGSIQSFYIDVMPKWDALHESVKMAWIVSTKSIIQYMTGIADEL